MIFAGKAHPKDEPGKEMIRRVVQVAKQLEREVTIVYIEDYDMESPNSSPPWGGPLAQHTATSPRSVGDLRHEGGA